MMEEETFITNVINAFIFTQEWTVQNMTRTNKTVHEEERVTGYGRTAEGKTL